MRKESPKVSLIIELYDKRGRKIEERKIKNANSFLRNYVKAIQALHFPGDVEIIRQDGTSFLIRGILIKNKPIDGYTLTEVYYYHVLRADAADNVDSYGIVVGTGLTAPTPDDYALEAKIAHGTGAGQLDYDEMTIAREDKADRTIIKLGRAFLNLSGGTISVSEVGLIYHYRLKGLYDSYSFEKTTKFLALRDVISPAVEVKPDYVFRVVYQFEFPV